MSATTGTAKGAQAASTAEVLASTAYAPCVTDVFIVGLKGALNSAAVFHVFGTREEVIHLIEDAWAKRAFFVRLPTLTLPGKGLEVKNLALILDVDVRRIAMIGAQRSVLDVLRRTELSQYEEEPQVSGVSLGLAP